MPNRSRGRGASRRRHTGAGQLDLAIADETGDKPVTCRGLFSANYLRRHFPNHESFSKTEEIAELYQAARRRWEDNADGLRNQNEAYTRTQFLDPLLGGLGWQFIPETQLPRGTKLERPDYCLFPDAARRQQAAAQPTNAATFPFADSVLEAKRWGHSLDKVSERETPGRFPAEQIESYLRAAKDATGRRLFNWAILSNGARWRLYTEHAGNGATFEFTLVDSRGQFCSIEDFRLFAALFRPAAFARDADGRCLLDRVREESLNRQLELEENLRERIFDVLEDLANAFREHAPNQITPMDYPALYQTSLIFLYRLLFVLYAESRELLPVFLPPREGASLLYRNRFSLAALVPRLKQPAADFQSGTLCDLYQRLLDLFHLIDGDSEALNREAKVTRYNGGLFDATQNPHIETSEKFTDNAAAIQAYQRTLRPGDVTLVGLVAQGGQGMRTANNARFLGYLAGTPQARDILARREEWTQRWLASPKIRPVFLDLLAKHGGDPAHPTRNSAAWEACVEPLREEFDARELGFGKTDLYRIVPAELAAVEDDFQFAWQQRKAELLARWRSEASLAGFWRTDELGASEERQRARRLKKGKTVSDDDFCLLCQELQRWVAEENAVRKRQRLPTIPRDALGMRSAENYIDTADVPRIATIYNGLSARGQFVPFRKGDPEGNRWVDNEPLFVCWSRENVDWLSTAPEARWQGHRFFLTAGITWTAVANHVAMKARYQDPCVFDADSMRLTPRASVIHPLAFLALLNSNVVSFLKLKFMKHTQKWEIGDLRQLPLVTPRAAEARRLQQLAERAMEAKRLTFTGGDAPHALVAFARNLSADLLAHAPAYLHPPAQQRLLATPADCLEVIELAVNWEAEKLYGVEGRGPFDEF